MTTKTFNFKCLIDANMVLVPHPQGKSTCSGNISVDSTGQRLATVYVDHRLWFSMTLSMSGQRMVSHTLLGCADNPANNQSIMNLAEVIATQM